MNVQRRKILSHRFFFFFHSINCLCIRSEVPFCNFLVNSFQNVRDVSWMWQSLKFLCLRSKTSTRVTRVRYFIFQGLTFFSILFENYFSLVYEFCIRTVRLRYWIRNCDKSQSYWIVGRFFNEIVNFVGFSSFWKLQKTH